MSIVGKRINLLIKNLLASMQQKFDLSNAKFPDFATLLRWTVLFAGSIVLSAFANVFLIKNYFFPELKSAATAVDEESGPALVMVIDRPKSEDFKPILSRNLFNSEQKEEVVKDIKAQSTCQPVKSDLQLNFTGVIYGGSKETSLVLLEASTTKQSDTFVLNDSVPGDAKIVNIERDKVFFEKVGADCAEYLELQQPEPFKKRAPNLARSRGAATPAQGSGAFEYEESGFARGREGNIVADRRWVDKALTTDFAKTLQDAKASPNLVNGEVKGFVLTRIRPDSVYEKMGFQNGDVVEQINGIDLNDAARAIQTLNSLKNENSIELMVKRNGTAVPLKIQVK